jgi:hypothetical protein
VFFAGLPLSLGEGWVRDAAWGNKMSRLFGETGGSMLWQQNSSLVVVVSPWLPLALSAYITFYPLRNLQLAATAPPPEGSTPQRVKGAFPPI